jgi:hypothetical protein
LDFVGIVRLCCCYIPSFTFDQHEGDLCAGIDQMQYNRKCQLRDVSTTFFSAKLSFESKIYMKILMALVMEKVES